ncbi:MAG: dihydrodipicolinate synthase family protein [Deltaproteobacteria bacterium 13_1_20CM_2_69_21]|nr:MAG: dihydrodipicolinate synthase family protein [Deltaproteobacteria bacterium 13_1_20CM_2_69_21]
MQGILAPVLTPFDRDLNPDPARLVRFCRALLDEGCDGLAPFGTTSEGNSLSLDERERLLDALLDSGLPPQKLIPGTGCCALPDTVRLSRKAARAGCAGVLMLPPFYYKNVTEEGLFRGFAQAIDRAAEPKLRVYLYHIPQVSQVAIPLGVIGRLVKAYPGVVIGMKDSSGDFENTRAVLRAFPGFEVFVGSEKFLLSNLEEGGAGCITATANVNAAAIARAFRERSEERQREIDAVRAAFEQLPLIAALKEAVARRTGDASWRAVRPPLIELTAEQRDRLQQGAFSA